jgi:uncharacterized protein (DUF427 family)
VERSRERVRVVFAGRTIADTTRALRVLETSHPPTYYIPRADIEESALQPIRGSSFCEFKSRASYFDVVAGEARELLRWMDHLEPRRPVQRRRRHGRMVSDG